MHRSSAAILALVLLAGLPVTLAPAQPAPAGISDQAVVAPGKDAVWHSSSLLVRFKKDADVQAALARAGVAVLKGSAAPLPLVPGLYRIDVPAPELGKTLAALSVDAAVMYAERNPICRAQGAQSVPAGVAQVGAPPAWATTQGAGVRVAVLDTGIDLTHPDLPVPVATASFIAHETVQDGNRHGTHVAGTIAGLDNAIGVVGVAPSVDLLVGKVLANSGAGTVDGVIQGMGWAVQQRARIVNLSLGGGGFSQAFSDACEATAAAGVLLVVAAGNNASGEPFYPAWYPSAMSVSAVDASLLPASFSNYGAAVSVAAPGVGIVSTVPVIAPTSLWASELTYAGQQRASAALAGSAMGEVTGETVWCGVGGSAADFPPAVAGRVAVIRRGGTGPTGAALSYRAKVLNAQSAGASAVIIANNTVGLPTGTLGGPVGLPVVGVTMADGDALQAASAAVVVRVTGPAEPNPYGSNSGTSMATPHVTGAAALLMAHYAGRDLAPTPMQVRRAIEESATDLGLPGRDDRTGAGLVNAQAALARLGEILTPVCSPADIADTTGAPGRDGRIDNGDFQLFFNSFFAGCLVPGATPCGPADISASDATPGADGDINGGDFQRFFFEFFTALCPD